MSTCKEMSASHSGPPLSAGSSCMAEEPGRSEPRIHLFEDCATARQVQDELKMNFDHVDDSVKPEMVEEGI